MEEIRTRKKFLAVGEAKHAWLHSDLLQALKAKQFVRSEFSTEGSLISASVELLCGRNTGR